MKKLVILFLILAIFYFPLLSAQNYGEGVYGSGLYGIGEVPPSPPTPSGGIGGGGGSACSYNWSCTNWFPQECPVTETQERICVNRGTCTGISGMPEQTRNCTYEKTEPLFDIFLTLPGSSKKTCAGKNINADVELKNYGKIELLDAFMTYWIVDENNTLISELKDTRSITTKLNFDVSLKIPESVHDGIYRIYAQITYSGNKTAVAGESFEINPDYCKFESSLITLIPFIFIGIMLVIILILIIILFRKLKRHVEKMESKKQKKALVKSVQQKISLVQKIKKIIKKYKKNMEERKMLREIEKQKRIAEMRKIQMQKENKQRRKREEMLKQKTEPIVQLKEQIKKEIKPEKIKISKPAEIKEEVESLKPTFDKKEKLKRKKIEEKYRNQMLAQLKKSKKFK